MSSFFSPSSYLTLSPKLCRLHFLCLQPHYGFDSCCFGGNQQSSAFPKFSSVSFKNSMPNYLSASSVVGSGNEGPVSVMNFEDMMEKDWSFLEIEETNSEEQHNQIISAAEIDESSKVLISIGSEGFIDRVINSSPCEQLLVVHESLLTLACIKEKYDKVKCWQGDLINLPQKWGPFDAVFLYFLPGLSSPLGQLLETLAKHCLPGNFELLIVVVTYFLQLSGRVFDIVIFN